MFYSHSLPPKLALTVLYRKYCSDSLGYLHYPKSIGYLIFCCHLVASIMADIDGSFPQTISIILGSSFCFKHRSQTSPCGIHWEEFCVRMLVLLLRDVLSN